MPLPKPTLVEKEGQCWISTALGLDLGCTSLYKSIERRGLGVRLRAYGEEDWGH